MNVVVNVFTGVFDVTNCVSRVLNYVRQNVAVVSSLLYSIIRFELRLCYCETQIIESKSA